MAVLMRREECRHTSPVGCIAASNSDPGNMALRGIHGDPFCRPQADLLGREFLDHDHGAATTGTRPGAGGRRCCCLSRRLRVGRLPQNLAANGYRLAPPWCRQKAEMTDTHKAAWQDMLQKAAQELVGRNCHFPLLVAV